MPAKKKTVKKKTTRTSKSLDTKKLELLVDSTVVLQKTVVGMTESVNSLAKRMDLLLELFEDASKNVSRMAKDETSDVEELAKKLESVIRQNKDLAHAVVALDRYVKEKGDVQLNPKPLFK